MNRIVILFACTVFCAFIAIAGSLDQSLVVTLNTGTTAANGFRVAVNAKGSSLTAANTLKSATIDVSYDNTKLTYAGTSFNGSINATNGYTTSATNNTTFVRVIITGGGVGPGDPFADPVVPDVLGFDIPSTDVTLATVRFTIVNTTTTTNLSILTGSNVISLFSTHSNSDGSGSNIAPPPTLTAPVNISGVALPVELTSFSASAHGRSVTLAWATATEVKNSGFQIERKALDAKKGEWQKVAFVNGHGTTNAPQSYGYTDALQVAGKYSYRLKQTDADGKFEYSKEVEAAIALQAQDYALSSNYPNPFNPTTSFHFAVKKAGNVSVTIFNTIGQEVRSLFNDVAQADVMYDLTFDGANLASGTYFYVLKTADRFEVKKMLMMK